MNVDEAIHFFHKRINYENFIQLPYRALHKNLDKLRRLLRLFGSPDRSCPVIHVTGSKGKGSLCAMLDRIFTCAGYKVGRFTSPHLHSINERFSIGDVPCSDDQFIEIASRLSEKLNTLPEEDTLTFFELATWFAFEYFASQKVDLAVIEVGLGGRFDATNVCDPVLSLISSISLEHTEQLGDNLASIAFEKAGIIKKGVPVITGDLPAEASSVVDETARNLDAPRLALESDFFAVPHHGSTFDYVWGKCDLKNIELSLWGEHQKRNAALALTVALIFRKWRWNITETSFRDALQTVSLPARIEKICEKPLVIIDGSHNPASVQSLVETLKERFEKKRGRLLFGTNQDKDFCRMLEILTPYFEEIVMTQSRESTRAVAAETLQSLHPGSRFFIDPEEGMRYLLSQTGPEDYVCVAGSFYLAAEMRRFCQNHLC